MIFVDTSAWFAVVDENDKDHIIANSQFKTKSSAKFITSNLVIIESLGWLRYKRGKSQAVKLGERLLYSPDILIERVGRADEVKSWKLFQKLDGRGVSMIDCTSFAVMRRLKIKEAFAFDEDFKNLGFKVYP